MTDFQLPRDGEVSRTPVGVGYNGYGLELNILPAATLHPRTVTKADIEKVMDAIDDALSSVCVSAQAIKCDCPSDDQIKVVLNAALTALGFEVADGE